MTRTMQPLRVRAHLASGIAHAAPWGIALDGILAAQIWDQVKTDKIAAGAYHRRALQEHNPADLDLPLSRCAPATGPWHWAATCAFPEGLIDGPQVHIWTGQLDRRDLEQVATRLPKTVSAARGRYRTHFMPLLVTTCTSLVWHAIGDLDQVQALLDPICTIGKKRTSGNGDVLRWEVTPAPDLSDFAAAHLHPDGTLGRPTPPACLPATWAGSDGGDGTAGVRPPYMHPSRARPLRLPAYHNPDG